MQRNLSLSKQDVGEIKICPTWTRICCDCLIQETNNQLREDFFAAEIFAQSWRPVAQSSPLSVLPAHLKWPPALGFVDLSWSSKEQQRRGVRVLHRPSVRRVSSVRSVSRGPIGKICMSGRWNQGQTVSASCNSLSRRAVSTGTEAPLWDPV